MCVTVHAGPHLPSGFCFMTLAMDLFCASGQTVGQCLETQAGMQGKLMAIFHMLCIMWGTKAVY